MKYELVLTGRFKKGLKLAKKRGLDISLLADIVEKLLHKIPLGIEDILTLTLIDTGTHADLFDQ